MDVIRVKSGESAPKDSDCIRIGIAPDGRFRLMASALEGCSEDAESVAMIRGEPYATRGEAEAAGIAWASDHCVSSLYIEDCEPDDEPQ